MKLLKYFSIFIGILMVLFVVYAVKMGDSLIKAKERQIIAMAGEVEGFLASCAGCDQKFPTGISAKAFLREYSMRDFVFFRADDVCTGLKTELTEDLLPFVTEAEYQIVVMVPPLVAIKRKNMEAKILNLGENHGQFCR